MTKQISILLVDDDPDDVFLFEEVLKGIDPTVDFQTASDGEQALDQLTHAKHRILPDLIFLDLNMPRMDGRLCLKKLKETPLLCDIPVIIYSTSSQLKDIKEMILSGAVSYVIKPSSFNELKQILSIIVGGMPGRLEEVIEQLNERNNLVHLIHRPK